MRSTFLAALVFCALAASAYSSEPCTDTIYASVFEDTVHIFHDGSFYNCCAVIAFDFEIGDTTIDIVETETFPQGPCHCMCCFDLSVSIGGVPPGIYWVCVWNEDKSVLYGKVKVVVGAVPSGPPKISRVWQSDCNTLVPGTAHEGSPRRFALDEPVPNPTIGQTRLFYQLDKGGTVSIRIYDSSGRLTSVLVEGDQRAGRHSMLWNGHARDGGRLPSGVYFIRLSSVSNVALRKLLIAR